MNIVIRKFMLAGALCAFVVAAPAIVLYAMGYRPAFSTKSIEPVGVLLVDSIPPKAAVSVHEVVQGSTPRAVANIPPGSVQVEVSKEGYLPWRKAISIFPGRATEVRGIRLFPEDLSSRILVPDTEHFEVSPNRSLIAAVDAKNAIRIISPSGQVVVEPQPLPGLLKRMEWSPDNTLILLHFSGDSYAILHVSNPRSSFSPAPSLESLKDVRWDPRIPGRILAVSPDLSIISLSLTTGTQSTLVRGASIFQASSRNLHIVTDRGEYRLYDLQGQLVESIEAVPSNSGFIQRLIPSSAGRLAVVREDESLALLEEDVFLEVAAGVRDAIWSPDGTMLLIHSKHNELYVYNLDNERLSHVPLRQLHQVVRLSREILHPQWFAGGQHILYQVNDEIVITEIDTRDRPISSTIDSTNRGNAHVAVGEDGESLLYLKQSDASADLVITSLITK